MNDDCPNFATMTHEEYLEWRKKNVDSKEDPLMNYIYDLAFQDFAKWYKEKTGQDFNSRKDS